MFRHELTPIDDYEGVYEFRDDTSGLHALIAIHSTALGPAFGGCRYWGYSSRDAAVTDVLRLSRGMSFKNALANLPFGGGKAVILRNSTEGPRAALFEAFGHAVQTLSGRYITAEDVGTSTADMKNVGNSTPYVAGLIREARQFGGDPSPYTAYGVYLGLREAWRTRTGYENVADVRVAVQGLGNVGYHLCRYLHLGGAKLTVADVRPEITQRVCQEFQAAAVDPADILASEVDILAPCALGGILNSSSIPKIRAEVIAGGANNQLATSADALALHENGILYAPDYVVNAGGIVAVAAEYMGNSSVDAVTAAVENISPTLRAVLTTAAARSCPPAWVADEMAVARIRPIPGT